MVTDVFRYLSEENVKNLEDKGFFVYSYISLDEISQTVLRDYLVAIEKTSVVMFILSCAVAFMSGSPLAVLAVFFGYYGIVFIVLFFLLCRRTVHFFHVSNVVYTHKGIILGNNIFGYKEKEALQKKLLFYEDVFDEYLSKPSRLPEVLKKKRKSIKEALTGEFAQKIAKSAFSGNSRSSSDASKAKGVIFLVFLAYVLSMVTFYYIGIFLTYIFLGIYKLTLGIIIHLSKSAELRIKHAVESIDIKIQKIVHIEKRIEEKIDSFQQGNIEDIDDFIEKHFSEFYNFLDQIIRERNRLERIINKSPYKKFIDFSVFIQYVKKRYNTPVTSMANLLKKYEKDVKKSLDAIAKQKTEVQDPHLKMPLEKKELHLQIMLKNIGKNVQKLHAMKIV